MSSLDKCFIRSQTVFLIVIVQYFLFSHKKLTIFNISLVGIVFVCVWPSTQHCSCTYTYRWWLSCCICHIVWCYIHVCAQTIVWFKREQSRAWAQSRNTVNMEAECCWIRVSLLFGGALVKRASLVRLSCLLWWSASGTLVGESLNEWDPLLVDIETEIVPWLLIVTQSHNLVRSLDPEPLALACEPTQSQWKKQCELLQQQVNALMSERCTWSSVDQHRQRENHKRTGPRMRSTCFRTQISGWDDVPMMHHEREIEVVASGLLLRHGAQLAIGITLRSAWWRSFHQRRRCWTITVLWPSKRFVPSMEDANFLDGLRWTRADLTGTCASSLQTAVKTPWLEWGGSDEFGAFKTWKRECCEERTLT